MSSRWRTGKRSEALDALPVVMELASETLDPKELEEAEDLAKMLVGTNSQKWQARRKLAKLVAPPPKRPLYYLQRQVFGLPTYTRDTIRYCGDYIDLLIKDLTYGCTGDSRVKENSLGRNLRILRPKTHEISTELLEKLKKYNSFLYRPGKHDFTLPKGRGHRFTSREAVLTVSITMKLANEIKSISHLQKLK